SKESKQDIFELACGPCVQILRTTNIDKRELDAVLFSSCTTEQYSSTILSEMLGIRPRVSHRIDNLCNSGTNAVASAYSLIASELCEVALVVGAEKANSSGNKLLWDITRGSFMLPVHWAAFFAKAHMQKFGTTEEHMAMVSAKNHKNASVNPKALFREPVSVDQVMRSRKIADPIKLLDCSAPCDGASAVLLASEAVAEKISENPVWIKGIGQHTSSASFANATMDLCTIEAATKAGRDAFKMAEMNPSDIDVAELHDAFTILEIIAYEDLGFAKKGEGGKFISQNAIAVNPRGGIIGCGHPVGATGVSQVAEVAAQLSGCAGPTQVSGCRSGLVHNLAAAGSSATVMIMAV
ncbi:MAG TPA: thiolase family protein, partial [Nitrososphaera sp.]|nr:thiolase family protein [Nitrososphaera sp.]